MGLEPMPSTLGTLTAQYLNVRQRKLGTIIIQTVHILQHDSAVTGSLPDGDFLHGQPNIFPINLAWQSYHYTPVPIEASLECSLNATSRSFFMLSRMFYELDLVSRFSIDHEVLCRYKNHLSCRWFFKRSSFHC